MTTAIIRASLEASVKLAASNLQGFPRNAIGLTPDEVKFSPEYRDAKQRYNAAFKELRRFNSKKSNRIR